MKTLGNKEKRNGNMYRNKKNFESNDVGYYKAFLKEFDGPDFYLGIDRKLRTISYYITNDFSNPMYVVECNNPYALIGKVPGVNTNILGKIFMKAFKVLNLDKFPEDISHQA